MATRKKKTETIDATTEEVAQVVKGTHLTVTTFPNGKVQLVWDDEALLREVTEAIASVDTKPAKKSKAKSK